MIKNPSVLHCDWFSQTRDLCYRVELSSNVTGKNKMFHKTIAIRLIDKLTKSESYEKNAKRTKNCTSSVKRHGPGIFENIGLPQIEN